MNFAKRALLSLWSRKGRTLITFATFLVISVMVLAGILINGATAQAEKNAKQSVGAEVNLEMDMSQVTTGQAPQIEASTVDKIGRLPQVRQYTYSMWDRALLKDDAKLVDDESSPMGPDSTASIGVLDSELLPDFRSGKFTLLSGEHLTAADKDKKRLLIEERLADENDLKAGDKITLTGNDEKTKGEFTVAGIFRDPRPSTERDPEHYVKPDNMLYGTVGGLPTLAPESEGPQKVGKATFLLNDADGLDAFKAEAERIGGSALDGFQLDANARAIQQMTSPLESLRSTSTLAMWLIGFAGAAVLALLVNLAVKQRRKEYGVLLSMGERKGKIVAQQALEIVVVAALAIGLSSLFAPALTQSAGQSLLSSEASDAQEKIDSWEPPAPGRTGVDEGTDPNDRPVENADPIDEISVALEQGDLATVGGVGMGIALLATALPAAAVVRLNPRTILTKGK